MISSVIRSTGAGYGAATNAIAEQTERAASHPASGVTAIAELIAQRAAHRPVLGKLAGLLHAGAGLGMNAARNNIVNNVRAPGTTVVELTRAAADLIERRHVDEPFSTGWGGDNADAEDHLHPAPSVFEQLGMR